MIALLVIVYVAVVLVLFKVLRIKPTAYLIATMIVAEERVDVQANTAHAVYSAALVRRWSSIQKAGNTAKARNTQGTIMMGLRPNRSESHPPRESQITPLRPITAVAPKAIFADMPSVTLAYVVMYSSR